MKTTISLNVTKKDLENLEKISKIWEKAGLDFMPVMKVYAEHKDPKMRALYKAGVECLEKKRDKKP